MKAKWKEAPLSHRIVTGCAVILSLTIVILAILQIFQIWTQAIHLCMPLMGAEMLCQAYIQWNHSRKVAVFSICTAAFIFVCAVVVFFI